LLTRGLRLTFVLGIVMAFFALACTQCWSTTTRPQMPSTA
jgi:hypothetical protein